MSLIEVICLCGVLVTTWAVCRNFCINKYRERAREEMRDEEGQGLASVISKITNDKFTVAELTAYAGVTAAEFVWSWAAISPDVVRGAAFSSGEPIKSGFGFALWLHQHYDSLAPAAKDGFMNRLLGYVGEQNVAHMLVAQGHTVHMAATATQPVWDMLIDGHAANIKTVTDVGAIKLDALHHPNVTYIVPEHAHGIGALNITHLHGFDHGALKDSLKDSLASAHGETAGHALGLHLPWITIGFAAYRNYKAYQIGKPPLVALNHAVIESVGKGLGVVIGGKVGAAAGFMVGGPVGALVGGVVGGVGGAIFGGAKAEEYKLGPLRVAFSKLDESLKVFGRSFEYKLESIRGYVMTPIYTAEKNLTELNAEIRRRHNTLRWMLWPDFYTVLLEEASKSGIQKIEEELQSVKVVTGVLDSASSGSDQGYAKVGFLMANCPAIRELLGFDTSLLQRIRDAQQKVFYERKQLDPRFQTG